MVLYCGVNRKTEWDSNSKTNTSDSKLEIYIFIYTHSVVCLYILFVYGITYVVPPHMKVLIFFF